MKIAKYISGITYTNRNQIIDNYLVVEDDYPFTGGTEDVTDYHTLSIFHGINRFNYQLFRQSLINNVLPNFDILSLNDKKNLISHRVYPSEYGDLEIEAIVGVDGWKFIKNNISEFEFVEDEVKFLSNHFTGFTATTKTDINKCMSDIINLTGQTELKLNTSIFNTYTGDSSMYKYNAGSAPTIRTTRKIFNGEAVTNSSGVATFEVTLDGLSTGTPIFNTMDSIIPTTQNNTSLITEVPFASIKDITNGKTITVNVINSASILMGGQGLEFVGAGITVYLRIEGI